MDEQAVRDAHETVRLMVNSGALHNAHDIAEGGIAVAIAECCIAGQIGATVKLPEGLDPFAEAPGRAFIVSGPESALAGLAVIGRVGGTALELEELLSVPVSELVESWRDGLVEFA
jgi:phosphoribosylformylglycinamidine synthase subunit PurL